MKFSNIRIELFSILNDINKSNINKIILPYIQNRPIFYITDEDKKTINIVLKEFLEHKDIKSYSISENHVAISL
ncbi:hypothetical protein CDFC105_71201 [Clostridioides difficile]|nr:hypothetical protein CDFC105_64260 [Clostridioides difficile]CZS03484.1 hypothetical protein CDFC105_71201 [Clostridioides difficile]